MMITKKEKREGPNRHFLTPFRGFSRLFMAFFSGQEANFHPQTAGPTFILPFQEGMGPLTARVKGNKEGPTTTEEKNQPRERRANLPPREERVNSKEGPTHSEKARTTFIPKGQVQEGPNPPQFEEGQKFTPQERKGQNPHRKDRTNSHPKNDKPTSNHEKEKTKPHTPKMGEPTKRAANEGGNSHESLPTFQPRSHCLCHLLCDTRSENLKVVPDQITPQIENGNAIAIHIAIQIEIKLQLQSSCNRNCNQNCNCNLNCNCNCVCVFNLWSDVVL